MKSAEEADVNGSLDVSVSTLSSALLPNKKQKEGNMQNHDEDASDSDDSIVIMDEEIEVTKQVTNKSQTDNHSMDIQEALIGYHGEVVEYPHSQLGIIKTNKGMVMFPRSAVYLNGTPLSRVHRFDTNFNIPLTTTVHFDAVKASDKLREVIQVTFEKAPHIEYWATQAWKGMIPRKRTFDSAEQSDNILQAEKLVLSCKQKDKEKSKENASQILVINDPDDESNGKTKISDEMINEKNCKCQNCSCQHFLDSGELCKKYFTNKGDNLSQNCGRICCKLLHKIPDILSHKVFYYQGVIFLKSQHISFEDLLIFFEKGNETKKIILS